MEVCDSVHHWGRELQARDHTVRVLLMQHVKCDYSQHRKTDCVDVEPTMACTAADHPVSTCARFLASI